MVRTRLKKSYKNSISSCHASACLLVNQEMDLEREKQLLELVARLQVEIDQYKIENQLLREKVSEILRRLYDKKSEALDPSQLELLLDPDVAKKAIAADPADPGPAAKPTVLAKRAPRKPRDISHLEVREVHLIPDEVKANPAVFRQISCVSTDRFDYQPAVVFIERVIRPVYVSQQDLDAAPLKSPAPPSLELGATARFIAYVLAAKYCHHRPFYRTQAILFRRHRVDFARNTFCHWAEVAAEIIEPLYKLIHQNLLQSGNLQADETPVKYLSPGKGKTSTGYLWVIHAPRNGIKGDILYQWHPSRKAACLNELIENYQGFLQTDAYAGYDSWTNGKPGITLVGCWAHARRKFHEALQNGQSLAAGPLATIQQLYQIETRLRETQADATARQRIRGESAAPLLQVFKTQLVALRQHPQILPKSKLGRAIDYTLAIWQRLKRYAEHGCLEIDNNWIENGIRPTAIGKKNWLFMGSETTGQRSAIIYTLVECARRHGHDPEVYLADILERLPAMTNQDDLTVLLPSNWQRRPASPALQVEAAVFS
jgi:transposase